MKTVHLNKNNLALILAIVLGIGFFVAGLFEVLDYFIIQVLLFLGFGSLVIATFYYGLKNDKKKRLEAKLQDDSH
jgi:hypothetical protein